MVLNLPEVMVVGLNVQIILLYPREWCPKGVQRFARYHSSRIKVVVDRFIFLVA